MISAVTIDPLVALATIALEVATVAFLALFFLRKQFPDLNDIGDVLARWGIWIAFALTLGGVAMSLLYSEVFGFAPCGLCWVQRIFLYSQAAMFGLAAIRNDTRIADYSILLSIFGGIVALYNHYLQMGGTSILPCPTTAAQAVDCAQRFFFEFGYLTFPLVGFSLFAFLIVLMLFVRERK